MTALNKITGLSLAFLFFCLQASSQEKDTLINHPDRYRLRLPDVWMDSKIIKVVTEILPKTIDELKNMGFCTDGKAAYYVFLIVDSLSVNPTGYSFHAALRIYDSLGKAISDLRLISSDEIFYSQRSIKTSPTNNYYTEAEYTYTAAPDQYGNYQRIQNVRKPPPVWKNDFINYSFIDVDILNVCKSKLLELRKLLKEL